MAPNEGRWCNSVHHVESLSCGCRGEEWRLWGGDCRERGTVKWWWNSELSSRHDAESGQGSRWVLGGRGEWAGHGGGLW